MDGLADQVSAGQGGAVGVEPGLTVGVDQAVARQVVACQADDGVGRGLDEAGAKDDQARARLGHLELDAVRREVTAGVQGEAQVEHQAVVADAALVAFPPLPGRWDAQVPHHGVDVHTVIVNIAGFQSGADGEAAGRARRGRDRHPRDFHPLPHLRRVAQGHQQPQLLDRRRAVRHHKAAQTGRRLIIHHDNGPLVAEADLVNPAAWVRGAFGQHDIAHPRQVQQPRLRATGRAGELGGAGHRQAALALQVGHAKRQVRQWGRVDRRGVVEAALAQLPA